MINDDKCRAESFIKSLYKNSDPASVLTITSFSNKHAKVVHFPVSEIDRMISYAKEIGTVTDTYFNINPLVSSVTGNARGEAEDVSQIVAFGSDYDIKHPIAHKKKDLPESEEVVLENIKKLPFPPTVIMHTGYGIDAFWRFKKPFDIKDEESFETAKRGLSNFGSFLMNRAKADGFVIDNVFDLPRMLRFPGSTNFKVKDQPVEGYIISDDGPEYEWDEIMALMAEEPSISPCLDVPDTDEEDVTEAVISSDFDPMIWGEADRITQKCPAIKYMVEHPDQQTEQQWYAASTNAVCVPNGEEWFHTISKDYPGYSWEETHKKYENAIKGKKVCSCGFFGKVGLPCPPGGCNVHDPFELAKFTDEERIRKLLDLSLPLALETIMADDTLALMKVAKNQYPMLYVQFKEMIKASKQSTKDFEYALNHYKPKNATIKVDNGPKVLTLSGLHLAGALVPPNYEVSLKNGVVLWIEDGLGCSRAVEVCPEPVIVSAITQDVDDGHMEIELTFFKNRNWGKIQVAPSVVFNKSQITNLANEGISVTSSTASSLVDYIFAYRNINKTVIPVIRSINRIGWMNNYKEFFPYCTNDKVIYEDKEQSLVNALHEKGSLDTWLEAGNKIRQHPYARCLLNASLASVLVPVINNRIILLHIWHNSRSGKTAVLKFALSVWGDPNELMGNFHSTAVGLERKAGILKHLPLGVDELQEKSKTLDPAMIVYQLGNGQGKTRGAKNGGLQETMSWQNAVITTGEQTLSSESSMDGVTNRAIEVYGAPLDDPEFGREVHQIAADNFGFVGKLFIEYLLHDVFTEKGKVKADYEKIRSTLKQRFDDLKKGDVGSHLDNVALMSLADYYSSLCIFQRFLKNPYLTTGEDIAFDDAIYQGLEILLNLKDQEKDDSITRAWSCVRDWIGANRRKFSMEADPCYGKFDTDNKKTLINASLLRDALSRAGFDPNKSFKGFAERGLIETHEEGRYKGRFQKTATVYGISMRVVVANIICDKCDLARCDFHSSQELTA